MQFMCCVRNAFSGTDSSSSESICSSEHVYGPTPEGCDTGDDSLRQRFGYMHMHQTYLCVSYSYRIRIDDSQKVIHL